MRDDLINQVSLAINHFYKDYNISQVILTRPEEKFGDFSTNIAMLIGNTLKMNPKTIAENIIQFIKEAHIDGLQDIQIAGPGFINFYLNNNALFRLIEEKPVQIYKDQEVIIEYSDPNPFKALHAGHLYTTIVGNTIANLIEAAGGQVHRLNYGSDVGLPVSKTMWGIIHSQGPDNVKPIPELEALALDYIKSIANKNLDQKAKYMSECYSKAHLAYEDVNRVKNEIIELNKRIYDIHLQNDHTSSLAQIYWTTREWSYDYFKNFYKTLGVRPFDKFYPESQIAFYGLEIVKQYLKKGIYQKSLGAIIFKGEEHGLHSRVFINAYGLPTYEAKEVGLMMKKWQDYAFDLSIIITGNDITEYMKVVLTSIEQFEPELVARTKHLTHGQIKLAGGRKMSSRSGNILLANDILEAAIQATLQQKGNKDHDIAYSAVKYSFLNQRLGMDIIFNPSESVKIEGNSGPYLQYAHTRALSMLQKTNLKITDILKNVSMDKNISLTTDEKTLLRKICEYQEIIYKATTELLPHYICTYLYELAQQFNRFYENNRVIGDQRQPIRLYLVAKYSLVLSDGLTLLGLSIPTHM